MAGNEDVLYMLRFDLSGGEAPGEHIAAVRSSANRVVASRHIKQMVDAHNLGQPDNVMSVKSFTVVTEEELEQACQTLRESDAVRVDAAAVYPDEKDRGRLIAPTAGLKQ